MFRSMSPFLQWGISRAIPIMRGVLIIEAMAQAAWFAGFQDDELAGRQTVPVLLRGN